MGQADELDRQRIIPISLAATASTRTLVGARENHVLHVPHHAAGPGPSPAKVSVHHRDHAAMDALLIISRSTSVS